MGHVPLIRSQLSMHLTWNTCLQIGISLISSLILKFVKQIEQSVNLSNCLFMSFGSMLSNISSMKSKELFYAWFFLYKLASSFVIFSSFSFFKCYDSLISSFWLKGISFKSLLSVLSFLSYDLASLFFKTSLCFYVDGLGLGKCLALILNLLRPWI